MARTMLALGTLNTLLVHETDALFRPMGVAKATLADGNMLAQWSLFAVMGSDELIIAKWIAIAALLLVAVGWRPRITGVLHWWVSCSFNASTVVVNGGDQITAVLTLLLLPITLTDGRRWHWDAPEKPDENAVSTAAKAAGLVAFSTWLVIRLQVAVIYFEASVSKLAVSEWANGTAAYYWFVHPIFGVPDWSEPVIRSLLSHAPVTMVITWGAITLEIILAMGLFMKEHYRPWLLAAGLAFHGAIAVIHGLFSFFFPMAAALLLYLRPYDKPLALKTWMERIQATVSSFPSLKPGSLIREEKSVA